MKLSPRVAWALLLAGAFHGCTCVDLTQGLAYQCSYVAADAGADLAQCSQGWRCGLENRCHAIGVPLNYDCTSDDNCEAAWRCAPNGQCVDPFADALRPNVDSGTPVLSKVSPLNFEGIQQLAVSEDFLAPDNCTDNGTPAFSYSAILRDGGLTKVIRYPVGRSQLPDGGPNDICQVGSIPYVLTDVVSLNAPAGAISMVELGSATTFASTGVLLRSGGGNFCSFDFTPPSSFEPNCTQGLLGFAATDLRSNKDSNVNGASYLAFSLSAYEYNDPFQSSGAIPFSGGYPLTDLDYFSQGYPFGVLVAATDGGTYVSTWPVDGTDPLTGTFAPGWYPAGMCPGSSFPTVHFRNFYPDTQGFDGGLVLTLEVDNTEGPQQVVVSPPAVARFYFSGLPVCPPIPNFESGANNFWIDLASNFSFDPAAASGDTPAALDILGFNLGLNLPQYWTNPFNEGPYTAEAHSSGLIGTDHMYVSTQAQANGNGAGYPVPNSPRFTRPKVFQNTNPDRFMEADDLGHLWLSRDNDLELLSLTLDRPPVAVAGSFASTLLVGTSPEVITSAPVPFEISPAQVFQYVPGLGLSALQANRNDYAFSLASATISGVAPRLPLRMEASADVGGQAVVLLSGIDTTSPFQIGVAALTTSPLTFRLLGARPFDVSWPGPYHSAVTTNSEGRTIALVTANDLLLSADVTDTLADAGAGSFPATQICNGSCASFISLVQSSPQLQEEATLGSGVPIDSVTAVSPKADAGSDGPYAEAYLLSNGNLFHVAAPTRFTWTLEPVSLPVGTQSDPLKAYKVFNDGSRGRVAFNDGSIYSLPSVVQIAPTLPVAGGGTPSSQDVVQLCQNIFELGADGLYSLEANTANPIGTWVRVPIDNSLLPANSNDWTGGKLFTAGNDLLLFHPLGWALRVTGYSCD